MFFRRIWILKLISEESTYKVKYGNCNLLSVYLYTLETTPAQARVYMMKNVLSSAEHGRCPHKH